MTSNVKDMGRGEVYKQDLPVGKRILFILLIVLVQGIYIPTSNLLVGGVEPRLPIDIFPIWSIWVLPYVLCYPLWLAGFSWAIFKLKDRIFRAFVTAFLVTCTLAVTTFIVFPTYIQTSTIQGNDIFSTLLRFIHHNWGRHDAFPSGHVYITVMLALFLNLQHPRYKIYWVLIPIIVSFATLFTHQHYIVDVLGGLVYALLGFRVGLQWAGILHFAPYKRTSPPSVL